MSVSILVATPHAAFGELIRLSLEESGQYQVRLVLTEKEARASLSKAAFQLAILDFDVSDRAFVTLCTDLIAQQPQMRLIVIPPDNNPNHPSLGGLMPHGYLNRPFYLPDLLENVQNLISEPPPARSQAAGSEVPTWASNPAFYRDVLEKELENGEAVAALVGANLTLLGSAGRLDQPAAQELAASLLRFWDPKEKTDLMRYMRLASVKGDYLVYATSITGDLVLMMVFDPSAQLGQVRPQTKQAASNLVRHAAGMAAQAGDPGEPPALGALSENAARGTTDEAGKFFQHASSLIEPETERIDDEGVYSLDGESFYTANTAAQTGEKPPAGQEDGEDLELSEGELEAMKIDLSQLLGNIPPPDPGAPAAPPPTTPGLLAGWLPEHDVWAPSGTPDQHAVPAAPSGANGISSDAGHKIGSPYDVEEVAVPVQQAASSADPAPPAAKPSFLFEPEPEIDPLSDTRPHVVTTLTNINQMEPATPALSLLNYTCVLLPRLPQHYLTGDLADRLAQWVQHLCLAFGWRLEGISLRPEYLQWTVQVAPSVSPGNLVRIIRQRTSLHIFSTFEHIKQQNPSGDFWATGYLIVSGPQPPSAQLLREYIAQTRKRQGIQKI